MLENYFEPFESKHIKRKGTESYFTLTLFSGNSNYQNTFFKNSSPSKDDILEVLGYIQDFLAVYTDSFKNENERESYRSILQRILPEEFFQPYQKDSTDAPRILPNETLESEQEVREKFDKIIENDKKTIELEDDKKGNLNDQTIIQICLKKNNLYKKNEVVGGMILEYYANRNIQESDTSFCILTYLFVRKNEQRCGLGKSLVKDSLPKICNNQIYLNGSSEKTKPGYVFFEVDNPRYINDLEEETSKKNNGKDSVPFTRSNQEETCIQRLKFFNDLGARWIDISYVQPKLALNKSRVYNLLLMVLIDNVSYKLRNPFIIPKNDLLAFLVSFYNTLESELSLNIHDFSFENENILDIDVDILRSWLIMEISDSIDEFESVGDEKINIGLQEAYQKSNLSSQLIDLKSSIVCKKDIVILLKFLKNELDRQFDIVADNLANVKDISPQKLTDILTPIFTGDIPTVVNTDKINEKDNLKSFIIEQYIARKILSLKDIYRDFKILKQLFKLHDVKYEDGNFYLKEIPKFTVPRLQFDKASVAFHIAIKSHVKVEEILKGQQKLLLLKAEDGQIFDFNKLVCPIFGSYQNDLLSYNYYGASKAPIKSKNIGSFNAVITFPSKIEFLSEGRKESIFVNAASDQKYTTKVDFNERKYYSYQKNVKCILNVMYFKPEEIDDTKYLDVLGKKDKIRNADDKKNIKEYELNMAKNFVWELIFTNQFHEEDTSKVVLSEFEIIQLSKFFSGKQEKSEFEINFEILNEPNATFFSNSNEQLFENIFEIIKRKQLLDDDIIYDIHAGTIQIDTENTKILSKVENNPRKSSSKNQEECECPVAYQYIDLFEKIENNVEDKDDLRPKVTYGKEYNTVESRIKALLEEYLKDNVDNIKLHEAIYLTSKKEESQVSHLEVYRNIREFHYDDHSTGFEDRYIESEFLKYFFDTLCGIALGIFDFGRMGYEEVTDTISPLEESATDKAFIVMKRASLFSCCHQNSVYESSINTIGISPYLIIPNSVLVYNLLSADENKANIEDMYSITRADINDSDYVEKRDYIKKSLNISKNDLYQLLIGLRKKIEVYTSNVLIPNIFNYSTEQEIYTIGMHDRGIDENVNSISATKDEVEESIKDSISTKQTIYGILMTIFLGVVSFIGIWDSIVQHVDVSFGKRYIDWWIFPASEYNLNLGPMIFWFVFAIFFFYFILQLFEITPQYVFLVPRMKFNMIKDFIIEKLKIISKSKITKLFVYIMVTFNLFISCTYKKVDVIAVLVDDRSELQDPKLEWLINSDIGHVEVYSFAKDSTNGQVLYKLLPDDTNLDIPIKGTAFMSPSICYRDEMFEISVDNENVNRANVIIYALPLDSLQARKLCSINSEILKTSMVQFVKQDVDPEKYKLLHNVYFWGKHSNGENSLSEIISYLIAKSQEKEH